MKLIIHRGTTEIGGSCVEFNNGCMRIVFDVGLPLYAIDEGLDISCYKPNISGLFGLRPPTADYGVTFALGIMTFVLIHFNKFKYQKVKGVIAGLCDPWPIWAPINIIGDIAVPISLSLRLFANVLSGTVRMALIYGLLSKIAIVWPAALHVYFDLFSGAIQTYVFCMLTMTYISNACETEEE